MADSVPSSPVPGGANKFTETTESTRLLNTATSSYNTRETSTTTRQTVITMSSEQENGHSYSRNIANGEGASSVSRHHIRNVISAGQPTIPTHQLTEKIQDILVFSEIKKNQQERALNKEKREKYKTQQKDQQVPSSDSSSSSDSDSDSDSEDGSIRQNLKKKLSEWSIDGGKKKSAEGSTEGKKLRKRDFAVDALRFATDKWKVKHGWEAGSNNSSSASLLPAKNNATATTTTTVTSSLLNSIGNGNEALATVIQQKKQKEQQFKAIPSSAENVFDVAKNASVCAVLALLHERRQSSGHSTETDISLQSLALSTLNLGLKVHDTSASQVVLYEMLTNKWMHGKSALEWAVENDSQLILNDKRVQLVIDELWKSGPNWRQDPSHPSNIWLDQPTSPTGPGSNNKQQQEEPKNFALYVIKNTFIEFLARWPSARYQALIALFSFLVYLAFHLASVSNVEYTSDTPFVHEYIYYILVISDVALELFKVCTQPCSYLKKISSYVTLVTVSLLFAAFLIRFFALLFVESIEEVVYLLTFSFSLVILATPLMFFRIFTVSTNLCWSSAKISYILHACFVNSIWVFTLGLLVVVGFWVSLAALQFEDASPFAMLRYLILGALHAPAIGETLIYQPGIAGLLLAVYLFFIVIVVGSLLIASFLSTILEIHGRIDTVKRDWVISRCLKTVPVLGAFIPSVAIDLIFGFIAWVSRVVFKRRDRIVWLEKIHQVLWYIIYSPIILLVGLYELIAIILFRWSLVANAFKRVPINPASYK